MFGSPPEPSAAVIEKLDVTGETDRRVRGCAREDVHDDVLEEEELRHSSIPLLRVFPDDFQVHGGPPFTFC
jgi:hypothetical protein